MTLPPAGIEIPVITNDCVPIKTWTLQRRLSTTGISALVIPLGITLEVSLLRNSRVWETVAGIDKDFVQMDEVTQQNAAAAEETASAAEELNGQSESLRTQMQLLTKLVHGEGSTSREVSASKGYSIASRPSSTGSGRQLLTPGRNRLTQLSAVQAKTKP